MKAGDRAIIHNSTLDGRVFVEGEATLVKKESCATSTSVERWKVRFDGEGDCFSRVVHEEDVKA